MTLSARPVPDARILKNDFTALNRFVLGMAGFKQIVKLGILGKKTNRHEVGHRVGKDGKIKTVRTRQKDTVTNAEIGLVHELGSVSRNIPARSFLRMPLHQRQEQILAEAKAGAEEKMAKGDTTGVLKTLGIAAENAVQDAFSSRGFGTWAPDSAATKARKGSDAPLIDSAQFRKSITSKVEKPG